MELLFKSMIIINIAMIIISGKWEKFQKNKQITQIKQDEDKDDNENKFELIYESENSNIVYLGKSGTILYGTICLCISPFVLIFPFENVAFTHYWIGRGILSLSLISIGLIMPRWFALITNDHVIKMYYDKKTQNVELQTLSTFLKIIKYQTKISNLQQIPKDSDKVYGNNIKCIKSQRQFFIDTAYLDDDILEYMGFIGDKNHESLS